MAIFKIEKDKNSIQKVPDTQFDTEGIREREHLQPLVKKHIHILENDLMVIAEEFGEWIDADRRIDLLCLDKQANLVVVELKRTNDGGHMELQALRYAAMVSTMTFENLVEAHARSEAEDKNNPNFEKARETILNFLGWTTPEEDKFGQNVRIILASADFGKELTTAVLWLNDYGLDIRCIRLKPYKNGENQILLDVQQLIPLPEVTEFQTQIGIKKRAERLQRAERQSNGGEIRRRWWVALLNHLNENHPGSPHANCNPTDRSWLPSNTGRQGISFTYVVRQQEAQVEVWIKRAGGQEANENAFDALHDQKEQIEAAFVGELEWQRLPERVGCRIRKVYDGGYRWPEEKWPELHKTLADAMRRLENAFTGPINNLP